MYLPFLQSSMSQLGQFLSLAGDDRLSWINLFLLLMTVARCLGMSITISPSPSFLLSHIWWCHTVDTYTLIMELSDSGFDIY